MDLPPIEDNEATWVTAISFAAFAIWKLWLRIRHEGRNDRAEAREHAAEGDVIVVLREEVSRLADSVRRLEEEREDERKARYAAERNAQQLQRRVEVLELRLRSLGHEP